MVCSSECCWLRLNNLVTNFVTRRTRKFNPEKKEEDHTLCLLDSEYVSPATDFQRQSSCFYLLDSERIIFSLYAYFFFFCDRQIDYHDTHCVDFLSVSIRQGQRLTETWNIPLFLAFRLVVSI